MSENFYCRYCASGDTCESQRAPVSHNGTLGPMSARPSPERETLSPALREQIAKDATGVAGDHGSTDCVGHGDPVAPFCKTMRVGHPLCDDCDKLRNDIADAMEAAALLAYAEGRQAGAQEEGRVQAFAFSAGWDAAMEHVRSELHNSNTGCCANGFGAYLTRLEATSQDPQEPQR